MPDLHGFVMQGTERVFLVHLPMFQMANHRYQLIITGTLPPKVMDVYKAARAKNPAQFYTLANVNPAILMDIVREGGSFDAVINTGFPADGVPPLAENFQLTNIHVIVNDSLQSKDLDANYPDRMPFYAYGTKNELHIDHLLRVSPNIQLNSDHIKNLFIPRLTEEQLSKGVVLRIPLVREATMQPM